MIKLTIAEAMQKAIDKARNVKPFVRVVSFGSYTVTNKQTGATYTVTCEKRNGERIVVARLSLLAAVALHPASIHDKNFTLHGAVHDFEAQHCTVLSFSQLFRIAFRSTRNKVTPEAIVIAPGD